MSKYGVISGIYFPVSSPNTGKYGPRITPFGHFSRSACLKNKGTKLELLKDNDMLMMIEKEIRGGLSHAIYRCAKAKNKYMKN